MLQVTLPFWMNKGELKKLAGAAQEFWETVETWMRISLTKHDVMTCDLKIVDYLAWERKVERLKDEPELIYRKRVEYAFVNAQDAGMTAGIYRIFDRLGVTLYSIEERQAGKDWDIVTLEFDDDILSTQKELINLLVSTYGATCRRYEYRSSSKAALTIRYGSTTTHYDYCVASF